MDTNAVANSVLLQLYLHDFYKFFKIKQILYSLRVSSPPPQIKISGCASDLKEMLWEVLEWIHVAISKKQWRALINTVMTLRVPWNAGNFQTRFQDGLCSRELSCGRLQVPYIILGHADTSSNFSFSNNFITQGLFYAYSRQSSRVHTNLLHFKCDSSYS